MYFNYIVFLLFLTTSYLSAQGVDPLMVENKNALISNIKSGVLSLDDVKKLSNQDRWNAEAESTQAYLFFIEKLIAENETKIASKVAEKLMKDAEKADAEDTRLAALALYVDANSDKYIDIALRSLKNPSRSYRLAALQSASKYDKGGILYQEVMKEFGKTSGPLKQDIAHWIALDAMDSSKRGKMQFTVPLLVDKLTKQSYETKLAVANALASLASVEASIPLISLMQNGNSEDVTIAKEALLLFDDRITDPLARSLIGNNDTAKVAIIEVLAHHHSAKHLGDIISLINTGNSEVKDAAYRHLPLVVDSSHISTLYSLLENTEKEYLPHIHAAIAACLNNFSSEERFQMLCSRVEKIDKDKWYLYYIPFSASGNVNMLQYIPSKASDDLPENSRSAIEDSIKWLTLDKTLEKAERDYLIDELRFRLQ